MLTSKKTFLIFFTAIILLAGIFTIAQSAGAANLPSLVPQCQNNPGGCNVCDAIGVGINITKIMLGTLGSAALLMFVYGGVLMAVSRGHTDQVQKGKDALTNAVKGVIIVLGSWVVINYGLAIMLDQNISEPVKIFNARWATVACNSDNSAVSCENKASGTDCGDNMVCDGSENCITECEYQKGSIGLSCMPLKNCKGYDVGETYTDCGDITKFPDGCAQGLCPGTTQVENTSVCCVP